MRFLGLEINRRSESEPEPPVQGAGVQPPRRDANVVTEGTALSLSSVYRSVQILTIAASQLTLDAWRGETPIEPKPAVIRQPDIRTPLGAWTGKCVASMALTGNGYWKIKKGDRGVSNVEVLNPHECAPHEDGTLTYRSETLRPGEFRHLKLLDIPGQLYGLGPIQAARSELRGALDQRDYQAAFLTSGDVPTGILKSEQPLTKAQAEEYKAQWKERDAHSVAVLGSGLDYRPILLAPEDAQFVEIAKLSKTAIATLFGIPAHMLLAVIEGNSMTYANMAQADLSFVRWTLMGYLKVIEDALTAILPGHQVARFNADGLIRPDITTRYKAHDIAIKAGFMDADEVRAIEGLPPRNKENAA